MANIRFRRKLDRYHDVYAQNIQNFVPTTKTRITYYLASNQECISWGNPFRLLGKTSRDIGSGFSTKTETWSGGAAVSVTSQNPPSGNWQEFSGMLYPRYSVRDTAPTGFGAYAYASENQMNAYGTTGIARALPTNPLAGLGQFLGELRQLPKRFDPSSWRKIASKLRRKHRLTPSAKKTAGYYLEFMFEWLPLIKDIRDFHDVTKNAEKYATQLLKNSGKHVRRGSTISNETITGSPVVEIGSNAYPQPVLGANYFTSSGRVIRQTITNEHIYFKGAFTYYLPTLPDGTFDRPRAEQRLKEILYGGRVDPELLWNLAPWSWAADWIANTGDIIHNWSAFRNDGLVMHYGYVMRHATRTTTWTIEGIKWRNPKGAAPESISQSLVSETKQRNRATPYGFGLNAGAFTPKQWSIIAALGISKAPRSLSH